MMWVAHNVFSKNYYEFVIISLAQSHIKVLSANRISGLFVLFKISSCMAHKCSGRNVKLWKQKNKDPFCFEGIQIRLQNSGDNSEKLSVIFDKYEFNATILVNPV